MRHSVDGRKFGRNTSHRRAMFRNMANSVIAAEQVVTTVQKAKEVRRVVDRLITLAKKGTPAARRLAFDRTRDNDVVNKLFTELSKRYALRNGGYTRVLKVADRRWGDGAEMAVLELVDHPVIDRKKKVKTAPATEQSSTDATAKDPFARFRKLFSRGHKSAGSAGDTETGKVKSAPKAAKKAAAKSTTRKKVGSAG